MPGELSELFEITELRWVSSAAGRQPAGRQMASRPPVPAALAAPAAHRMDLSHGRGMQTSERDRDGRRNALKTCEHNAQEMLYAGVAAGSASHGMLACAAGSALHGILLNCGGQGAGVQHQCTHFRLAGFANRRECAKAPVCSAEQHQQNTVRRARPTFHQALRQDSASL